jgi:hypothetical protein
VGHDRGLQGQVGLLGGVHGHHGGLQGHAGSQLGTWFITKGRVFNDLIDDFTKSDFKSFCDDFEIFKIILKYGDLI